MEVEVTHRIVEVSENEYHTKGDYNNSKDLTPVKQENIRGKVIFNSFFLGYTYVHYRYYLLFLVIMTVIVLNIVFKKEDEKS